MYYSKLVPVSISYYFQASSFSEATELVKVTHWVLKLHVHVDQDWVELKEELSRVGGILGPAVTLSQQGE